MVGYIAMASYDCEGLFDPGETFQVHFDRDSAVEAGKALKYGDDYEVVEVDVPDCLIEGLRWCATEINSKRARRALIEAGLEV